MGFEPYQEYVGWDPNPSLDPDHPSSYLYNNLYLYSWTLY